MTAKKTTEQKLLDARNTIRRRGREIGALKRRVKRLGDADIMMKRHELHWMKLRAENEDFEARLARVSGRIRELGEQLQEATKEGDSWRECYDRRVARDHALEDRVRELLGGLAGSWRDNDLLRAQLAGSEIMPDGRAFREYLREAACKNACDALDEEIGDPSHPSTQ